METLHESTVEWAEGLGIFEKSDPKTQALKFASEAGELCDEIAVGDIDAAMMELGDVLVTLSILCEMLETAPDHCHYLALNKIQARTGRMENGVFIRDE